MLSPFWQTNMCHNFLPGTEPCSLYHKLKSQSLRLSGHKDWCKVLWGASFHQTGPSSGSLPFRWETIYPDVQYILQDYCKICHHNDWWYLATPRVQVVTYQIIIEVHLTLDDMIDFSHNLSSCDRYFVRLPILLYIYIDECFNSLRPAARQYQRFCRHALRDNRVENDEEITCWPKLY